MPNVAKLKKQAAELEAKKQFDKALVVYVKLLESFDEHGDELDVSLFNRVGDLMLRQGNVADAVDYYEQAVDRYAETKLFNNAIALCNKILRHSPGRASIYYKLGKIAAIKGFKSDAKNNFLEYADRMQKAGKVDEAFRALKEFADLSPDQDEIRLMLADHLLRNDRKSEALEQLQLLHERYDSEGRLADATTTANRIRAIDPTVEPRAGGEQRERSRSELVFIDLNAPPVRPSGQVPAQPTPSLAKTPRVSPPKDAPPPEPAAIDEDPVALALQRDPSFTPGIPATAIAPEADLDDDFVDDVADDAPQGATDTVHSSLDSITRLGDDAARPSETPAESILGLVSTHLSGEIDILELPPPEPLLDIEPTTLSDAGGPPLDRSAAPTHSTHDDIEVDEHTRDIPIDVPEPRLSPRSAPSIDFDLSELLPAEKPRPPKPSTPTPLDGIALIDESAFPRTAPASPSPKPRSQPLGLPEFDLIAAAAETLDVDADVAVDPVEEIGPPASLDTIQYVGDSVDSAVDSALAEAASVDTSTRDSSPSDAGPADGSSLELVNEPFGSGDYEPVVVPTPSFAHRSTTVALHAVEALRGEVAANPEKWGLRRQLAEAMFEAGDRAGGIRELETAMAGAERSGDLDFASSLAEEIARLEPEVVKHHQKRVEYAFRTNDRPRLIEAYVSLADALLRSDQVDKSRIIYQRVLDLAPDEPRARAALDTIAVDDEPPVSVQTPRSSATTHARPAPPRAAETTNGAPAASRDFVNLGDWLRDEAMPRDTRMVVAEQEPTGDEEADFADMLRKFKQGVAENVDPEDYQSHYDLAIAYKEMGLLDEAIAEFQRALGSPTNRLPTFEALGQCFIEQGQFKMAASVLGRALNERAPEDQMIGVLYLLGRAAEAQGQADEALGYYQRVFLVDIQFRDIAERMSEVERSGR